MDHRANRDPLSSRDTDNTKNEDENKVESPPPHSRSLACTRRPLRSQRSMQQLLVHVLAHRGSLPQTTPRGEQSRPIPNRKSRSASGSDRLRWRQSRRMVPTHAPRSAPLARPHITAQARRRPSCLVALLLLHPHRLSPKGRHLRSDRSSHQGCKARQSSGSRSLSSGRRQNPQHLSHRVRHDLGPRRIQNRSLLHPTPSNHATQPEIRSFSRFRTAGPPIHPVS